MMKNDTIPEELYSSDLYSFVLKDAISKIDENYYRHSLSE